jgi:NADH-quinone oxidoreductase subunit J
MSALNIIMLVIMIMAALWAVVTRSLLKSALGLAIISLVITIFMYKFDSALAGVFELSVCTGLITVIFLSTIGLTKPMTAKQIEEYYKERISRYVAFPLVLGVAGFFALALFKVPFDFKMVSAAGHDDVRNILWNVRNLDLLGQIIVLLAGGVGVVVLFKEREPDEW